MTSIDTCQIWSGWIKNFFWIKNFSLFNGEYAQTSPDQNINTESCLRLIYHLFEMFFDLHEESTENTDFY